jgi:hypothetical protein
VFVATAIVDQTNHGDIAQMNASRAKRGRDLYLRSRQLITRTGEDCTCTDYGVHQGRIACKHLTAVALLYARRRRPCACLGGKVYIGHLVVGEDGVESEVVEAVPCRRCAS